MMSDGAAFYVLGGTLPRNARSYVSRKADQDLLDALRGNVASWWIPDRVIQVASMPLAPTGKIDKNRLRAEYAAT